ncbi:MULTISPECIES: hypothetical protein [Nocardiopsis]|uniref:hypothetical protein n=1 Tax=Nocardiopsis TaxID=2013 RepID=UPI00200D5B69|nr:MULTISPECIES: hypothetical protein [Nocardiopsis]MCK9871123.1 hypothetical protein [Nocardiopsis dassonvillei]WDZ90324.1 hypothetical protein PV789_26080 [Nocardiopsis sp. HUAS JQ3]
MKVSSVVSFVAFVAVFVLSRQASRRFLAETVELSGFVLEAASFAASLALAGLASGAVLYTARLFQRD